MRHNLKDAPEVMGIADALNVQSVTVVGCLHALWCWFDEHTTDGQSSNVTTGLIDRIVGVPGFSDATIAAGWLVRCEEGLSLPNFDRHNGHTAKSRALSQSRMAKSRSRYGQAQQERNTSATGAQQERNTGYASRVTKAQPEESRGEESRGEVVSAETKTTDGTDETFPRVQAVLERRLGYQLGSFDLRKLADIREGIRTSPVEVAGVGQSWADVAIKAIEVMPGNVGSWPTYVGTTIENIRQRGAWPVQRADVAQPVTAESIFRVAKRSITFGGETVPVKSLGWNKQGILRRSDNTVFVPLNRLAEAQVDRG
jgi:hypothetical protein